MVDHIVDRNTQPNTVLTMRNTDSSNSRYMTLGSDSPNQRQVAFDDDDDYQDSDEGSNSSGAPERWGKKLGEVLVGSNEELENMFLDTDVAEDDLLDTVFDANSVVFQKTKTCMLCEEDFK